MGVFFKLVKRIIFNKIEQLVHVLSQYTQLGSVAKITFFVHKCQMKAIGV